LDRALHSRYAIRFGGGVRRMRHELGSWSVTMSVSSWKRLWNWFKQQIQAVIVMVMVYRSVSERKVSGVGDSEEERNKFNMVTCFRNDYFSI